jgi:hypothetical protein
MSTSDQTKPSPPGIDAAVWEDFADYLRDWRSQPCPHSDLACCAPCLRDRIKEHLTRREPTPTMPVLPTWEIAFEFQDGEVMTIDQLRSGLGLFDDEIPTVVARKAGDEGAEWIALGDEFRAEHDPHRVDGAVQG